MVSHSPGDTASLDSDLLRRIVARDEHALAELYDRYSSAAMALAFRMMRERGQAEDIVQESFLTVWRRAGSFDSSRGSARSWLLAIVHHACIDRMRGRHRHLQREVDIDDHAWRLATDDVSDEVHRRLEGERVRHALLSIPPEQRQALELAYFGGLTQAEIAARTGEPLGTIKSRARLGLRRLERLLRSGEAMNEDDGD